MATRKAETKKSVPKKSTPKKVVKKTPPNKKATSAKSSKKAKPKPVKKRANPDKKQRRGKKPPEVKKVDRIATRPVGRPRLFEDPTELEKAIEDYYTWSDSSPWYKNEVIKSGERAGEIVQIPVTRPYTLERLCTFLGVGKNYFEQFEKSLSIVPDGETPEAKAIRNEFSGVITRAREERFAQKFEGAAINLFNANIIARDLGLVDKKDHTTAGESINKGYFDLLKARRTLKKPEAEK